MLSFYQMHKPESVQENETDRIHLDFGLLLFGLFVFMHINLC